MDILSPFISVLPLLCHSDWLFLRQSCPRVHPGRAWSSSPACTWHCSLHYLFLQATPRFLMVCALFTLALLRTHSFVSFAVYETHIIFSALSSQRRQNVFLHSFWVSSFHSRTLLQATLALSLVVSSLKSVCCDFSIFSAAMSQSPVPCLTWYEIPSYTHHLV